ncbi:hypothetical protein ACH5RR_004902 [Cinchona calisaya]|uniref:Mitochondrial glycoprotein n=1 Tax=Cinchona calisaya TaxID=153742 RepID=A0ABD3AZ21_9GENT
MALSSMISKASPSVVPLALRAISCAGSLHGSMITAAANGGGSVTCTFVQSHQFSTVITAKKLLDSSLLKVLRSEIKTAKKHDGEKQEMPKIPSAFPFKITDNPGERTITLTRDFPDETIEIKVREAQEVEEIVDEEDDSDDDSCTGTDEEDCNNDDNKEPSEGKDDKGSKNVEISDSDSCSDDDCSGEDDEDSPEGEKGAASLPMSVTVCKKDGRRLKFELDAALDEDIKITHMSIEEYAGADFTDAKVDFTGPDFEKLDQNLQQSLLKYLEIRGIKDSLTSLLHKYMIAKSHKDDILWLNKLKKFVKN